MFLGEFLLPDLIDLPHENLSETVDRTAGDDLSFSSVNIPRATRLPQTVQGVRVGADLDLSPRPRDMEDLSACAPGPVRGWLKL